MRYFVMYCLGSGEERPNSSQLGQSKRVYWQATLSLERGGWLPGKAVAFPLRKRAVSQIGPVEMTCRSSFPNLGSEQGREFVKILKDEDYIPCTIFQRVTPTCLPSWFKQPTITDYNDVNYVVLFLGVLKLSDSPYGWRLPAFSGLDKWCNVFVPNIYGTILEMIWLCAS